jgi:signal transduction histidine kinase
MDPNRVEQILTNLINNAIKFTDHRGRVHVTAEIESDKPEYLKVSVFDNGCGISPKNLENIFERLYQVNPEQNANETCTSLGGLGLGLNICRELVNLHDGKITVKSLVNKGSEFSFTLPIYDVSTGINSLIQEVNLDTLIKEQTL